MKQPRNPKAAPRGFAAMPPKQCREIQSAGGKSHSREHMARIGRKGGKARQRNYDLVRVKGNEQ